MKSLLHRIVRAWPTTTIDTYALEERVRESFPTTADYQMQGGYGALAIAIDTAVREGWLTEVKRAPSNGREPALKARYRRVREAENRDEIERVVLSLHAAIDSSYYRTAPLGHWERDRSAILALDRFLRRADAAAEMAIPCSLNERSLQVFGDEKALRERGQHLLHRLGLTWSWLQVVEMTEPFSAEKYQLPVRQVLVVENQDTYHTLRRILNEGGTPFIGPVDLLVYGEGKKIIGSLGQLEHVYGISQDGWTIRYFGDVDPEGVEILHQLCERHPMWPIQPHEPFYEALLTHGVCRLWERPWTERLDAVRHHFSESLRARLQKVAATGTWFPQEGLRYSFFRSEVSGK